MTLTLALFSSVVIGFLLVWNLCDTRERIPWDLFLVFSCALGTALTAMILFASLVITGQLHPGFAFSGYGILLTLLIALTGMRAVRTSSWISPRPYFSKMQIIGVIALAVASIPLWYHAHFYLYGGWDAWATWNFKAKLIFLGGDHWTNMFDPILWRSSPHYPLLLPLINVWLWLFSGEALPQAGVLVAYTFTMLTCGVLYMGLRTLCRSNASILAAVALMTLPVFIKLSLSQYADIVVAYFLLAALVCITLAKKENLVFYARMAGIHVGLLTFVKNEGLTAALILALLYSPYIFVANPFADKRRLIRPFFLAMFICAIPTIIFSAVYVPESETFINGLTSSTHPIDLLRFKTIFGFYLLEFAVPLWNVFAYVMKDPDHWMILPAKWHGLWTFFLVVVIAANKRCFNGQTCLFPVFLLMYGGIVTVYYLINTYFPVDWWLQVSLHRLTYAVMPATMFWIYYAVFQPVSPAASAPGISSKPATKK